MEKTYNFTNLFEQLKSQQQGVVEPTWLIYAETLENSPFTKSLLKHYEHYLPITS